MKHLVTLLCIVPIFVQAKIVDCEETECDLGQLLQTCRALEENPQIKPFSSKILCRGSETFWELKDVSSNPLAIKEVAFGKVAMKGDKYNSKETGVQQTGAPFEAECHDYKEMTGQYAPTQKVISSCDELEEIYTKGQAAYCHEMMKEEKVPLVEVKETGVLHQECGQTPQPEPEPAPEPAPEPEPSPEPGPIGPCVCGHFQQVQKGSVAGNWYEFKIVQMDQNGMLQRLGLKLGDRVQSVNGRQFLEVSQLVKELDGLLSQKRAFRVRVYIALADSYRELKYTP